MAVRLTAAAKEQDWQREYEEVFMSEAVLETPSPDVCASTIFEISGAKFDPYIAVDLWPKILQHKWLMSEKLGRDVGLRTACIDFIEIWSRPSKNTGHALAWADLG